AAQIRPIDGQIDVARQPREQRVSRVNVKEHRQPANNSVRNSGAVKRLASPPRHFSQLLQVPIVRLKQQHGFTVVLPPPRAPCCSELSPYPQRSAHNRPPTRPPQRPRSSARPQAQFDPAASIHPSSAPSRQADLPHKGPPPPHRKPDRGENPASPFRIHFQAAPNTPRR